MPLVLGFVASYTVIIYNDMLERVQRWSESFDVPKHWTRRFIHAVMYVVTLAIILSIAAVYVYSIGNIIIQEAEKNGLIISFVLLFLNGLAFITPAIILRKRVFKEPNIKKWWKFE
jgi:cytochrome c biogenesis protein CcdA